jgi:hypothetical protein
MNDEQYSDLDPNEREVLRSLSNAATYSSKAEDRTVQMLKRRGLIIGSTTSPWVRYVKLGGMVAALFVAFFLGTQYGGHDETQTDGVVTPVPDDDRLDQQASPEGSVPDETMLTAFHMGVDHPIDLDSADSDENRYTVSGKMIDP